MSSLRTSPRRSYALEHTTGSRYKENLNKRANNLDLCVSNFPNRLPPHQKQSSSKVFFHAASFGRAPSKKRRQASVSHGQRHRILRQRTSLAAAKVPASRHCLGRSARAQREGRGQQGGREQEQGGKQPPDCTKVDGAPVIEQAAQPFKSC